MFKYTLKELNQLAEKHNFNRDTLEKVLRLNMLLVLFNTQEQFKNHFILKGGTAINLCFFNLPRLSVDIDMDYNKDCDRQEMISNRENFNYLIKALVQLDGFNHLKKHPMALWKTSRK